MDQKSHFPENYHVTHLLTIVSRFVTFFMLLFWRKLSGKVHFHPDLSSPFAFLRAFSRLKFLEVFQTLETLCSSESSVVNVFPRVGNLCGARLRRRRRPTQHPVCPVIPSKTLSAVIREVVCRPERSGSATDFAASQQVKLAHCLRILLAKRVGYL